MVFTGAFYPEPGKAYAMATRVGSQEMNYLIKFDWSAQKADLYEIKGFDQIPYSLGVNHLDSLIYDEDLTAANNLPIKGFIVGGTATIWSYNDQCNEPDFGLPINQY